MCLYRTAPHRCACGSTGTVLLPLTYPPPGSLHRSQGHGQRRIDHVLPVYRDKDVAHAHARLGTWSGVWAIREAICVDAYVGGEREEAGEGRGGEDGTHVLDAIVARPLTMGPSKDGALLLS